MAAQRNDIRSTKPLKGSVAVIGAGVSGLAAAYRLKKEGIRVTVYDSMSSPGGAIQSFAKDGFIWDRAANTMASNSLLIEELIEELQLEDKRIYPRQQNKRYILRNGRPVQIPTNPLEFVSTSLLSTPAKLRLLAEPLLWKKRDPTATGEESLRDFLERHVGKEPVDYLADPFCGGTAGSDAASLSVRYSFPQLFELEEKYGSLVVGAIRSGMDAKKKKQEEEGEDFVAEKKKKKTKRGSYSFLGGMQTLPNALAESLGSESLRLGTAVDALSCRHQHLGGPHSSNWDVSVLRGTNDRGGGGGGGESVADSQFDAVIVTVPIHSLHNLRLSRDGQPYTPELPAVTYQPMNMLINAFRLPDVQRPLPGFGLLVPFREQKASGLSSIGTLFSSFMFPDRCPPGEVLFTTFVGGSLNRDLASKPSEELLAMVLSDLHKLLGVTGAPIFSQHVRWKQGFPQYGKDYGSVLSAINKLENDLPGLFYAGNHVGGLAVGKAIVSGYDSSGRVMEYLRVTDSRIQTMAISPTTNSVTG